MKMNIYELINDNFEKVYFGSIEDAAEYCRQHGGGLLQTEYFAGLLGIAPFVSLTWCNGKFMTEEEHIEYGATIF